jgi:hypothetical protein
MHYSSRSCLREDLHGRGKGGLPAGDAQRLHLVGLATDPAGIKANPADAAAIAARARLRPARRRTGTHKKELDLGKKPPLTCWPTWYETGQVWGYPTVTSKDAYTSPTAQTHLLIKAFAAQTLVKRPLPAQRLSVITVNPDKSPAINYAAPWFALPGRRCDPAGHRRIRRGSYGWQLFILDRKTQS